MTNVAQRPRSGGARSGAEPQKRGLKWAHQATLSNQSRPSTATSAACHASGDSAGREGLMSWRGQAGETPLEVAPVVENGV